MTTGMIGRKLGMMRVFDGSGRVRGVTVIELGPNYVTQVRTPDRDGYSAVQLAFSGKRKRLTQAQRGHLRVHAGPGDLAVVVDATLVPQRDGPLAGRRLRFPDQERSVDSGTEEVLGRVPGDRPVIPGVFFEGVDRRDVVGRDPADGPCRVVSLAPHARLVVAQDPDL